MKPKYLAIIGAVSACLISGEIMAATEWNVSLWGKRRAFTENVEKLAELVEKKTNGDFKLKISYGGLSKSRENLDGSRAKRGSADQDASGCCLSAHWLR